MDAKQKELFVEEQSKAMCDVKEDPSRICHPDDLMSPERLEKTLDALEEAAGIIRAMHGEYLRSCDGFIQGTHLRIERWLKEYEVIA